VGNLDAVALVNVGTFTRQVVRFIYWLFSLEFFILNSHIDYNERFSNQNGKKEKFLILIF